MRRRSILLLVMTLLGAAAAVACSSDLVIDNALPRVTWVAVTPAVDDVAEITVWVSDLEGDSVDLEVTWSDAAGDPSPIHLASDGAGHGLEGLTTRAALSDPNGQPHLIRWDTTTVSGGAITLRFVADDREAGRAGAVASPAFGLDAGLPEAVRVE